MQEYQVSKLVNLEKFKKVNNFIKIKALKKRAFYIEKKEVKK